MDNLPDYKEYKDCLVAFIDVLGFDKRARGISNGDEFFEVSKLLYAMQKTAEAFSNAGGILEEYTFTAISDSIIVTVPFANKTCTTGMLHILHKIQYEMLGTEFKTLVRGYITKGPVYHKNGLIFGTGYSDAYKGEGLIGGAPRIVLDPSIFKDAKRVIASNENRQEFVTALDYLAEDSADGFHFVDYLNPTIGSQKNLSRSQLDSERASIRKFIDDSVFTFENDCGVRAKYKWLENYFRSTEKYFSAMGA